MYRSAPFGVICFLSALFAVIYAVLFRIFAQTVSAFFRIRCGESETQSAFLNFKKHSAMFVVICQFETFGILFTEFQKSVSQIRVMSYADIYMFFLCVKIIEKNDTVFGEYKKAKK